MVAPLLVIFSGLPGAGKTAIARELARMLGAVYLRIDSMEQALRDSGRLPEDLADAGYRAGYAVAEDNLRLGRTVVADSVNPLSLTRNAWRNAARRAQAAALEVEVVCSDQAEHRHRVETRTTDVPGLRLPSWDEVASREYHTWEREHLIIDTAGRSIPECVAVIHARIVSGNICL